MAQNLTGKIAIVTDASCDADRGISLELALVGCKGYIICDCRSGKSTTQYDILTLNNKTIFLLILVTMSECHI